MAARGGGLLIAVVHESDGARAAGGPLTPIFTKLFPTVLIVLDLAASMTYLYFSDWRRAVYWFAAAVLTASVPY